MIILGVDPICQSLIVENRTILTNLREWNKLIVLWLNDDVQVVLSTLGLVTEGIGESVAELVDVSYLLGVESATLVVIHRVYSAYTSFDEPVFGLNYSTGEVGLILFHQILLYGPLHLVSDPLLLQALRQLIVKLDFIDHALPRHCL